MAKVGKSHRLTAIVVHDQKVGVYRPYIPFLLGELRGTDGTYYKGNFDMGIMHGQGILKTAVSSHRGFPLQPALVPCHGCFWICLCPVEGNFVCVH